MYSTRSIGVPAEPAASPGALSGAMSLSDDIRRRALDLGFSAAGFASARDLVEDGRQLEYWLENEFHAGMAWMARDPERRFRPQKVLPGARSVVVVAINYAPCADEENAAAAPVRPGSGRVSRYAWGRDYHALFEERLPNLTDYIVDRGGPGTLCRWTVDYGPVLEKAYAREAGLGFIGKNTLMISETYGSWLFLGVILTTLDLEPGEPQTSQCGGCRICLDACPTGALTAPFQLDARRCISYLTIEHRDAIPVEIAPAMGDWIFGCDICQTVCPYNQRTVPTEESAFGPDHGMGSEISLKDLLSLRDERDFRDRFSGSPLRRSRRAGLVRNAVVVSANQSGTAEALRACASGDPDEMVRRQARGAIEGLTRSMPDSNAGGGRGHDSD